MIELVVAAILIVINGLFALSELAIVSARKPKLKILAEQRHTGAKAALRLAEHPGRFLSTVQIGITLVGVLAGAFSGAALGDKLAAQFVALGMKAETAEIAGFGIVITTITFLSVIIGELVPKHLALKNPERIACFVAPAMQMLSRVAAPIVLLLDATTRLILFLLRIPSESENAVTDEEIRTIVAEAQSAGVIEREEQTMISAVMRLGDRTVRAIMTPRTEVEMITLSGDADELRKAIIAAEHSWLPVCEGAPDTIIGAINVREALVPLATKGQFAIKSLIRKAPVIPDTADALAALKTLREAEVPFGLVHDEFGHFEGVLTPADILDAIAGAFKADDGDEPEAVQRADGSWLIAGWMPVDEMADMLYLKLPARRGYDTVAGFVLDAFQRLPETGDRIDASGWRFEVVDMDGRRIDKVLASRVE